MPDRQRSFGAGGGSEMTDHQSPLPVTVWMAQRHIPYEGFEILGVFSSEALAQAFIDQMTGDKYDVSACGPWEVDTAEERVYENIEEALRGN